MATNFIHARRAGKRHHMDLIHLIGKLWRFTAIMVWSDAHEQEMKSIALEIIHTIDSGHRQTDPRDIALNPDPRD